MSFGLYAASMAAMRVEKVGDVYEFEVAHSAALIQTCTAWEAEAMGVMRMSHKCPPAEGWIDHTCKVLLVSGEVKNGCWQVEVIEKDAPLAGFDSRSAAFDGSARLDD